MVTVRQCLVIQAFYHILKFHQKTARYDNIHANLPLHHELTRNKSQDLFKLPSTHSTHLKVLKDPLPVMPMLGCLSYED